MARATALSGDGRYVAFVSDASNLVTGDTNSRGDVSVRHWIEPTVTEVDPDVVGRGTSVTLSITGSRFLDPSQVFAGSGITVNEVTRLSETELSVAITVAANAPIGAHNVVVANPGLTLLMGSSGLCAGCLTT